MTRLFNTLTRQKEEFAPLEPGVVRMYTCGPTVYRFVHIGNLRSYLMADWLRRILESKGYSVQHVKNITDVGHMRQDMVDRGEDKMIAAALAEGKTPQEIAETYTQAFHRDEQQLLILPATVHPKATQHVPEMISIIQRLVERGHAYEVEGTLYFAVNSFPNYGRLSGNQLESLLAGVRAEADPRKRNPADFALWKAAEPGRMVKWPSPWGEGFPGWHIECSAMSTRYLGPRLDIHTGGVDNIFPHHEDEIAQSEAALGGPFVRYWVHGQHLMADGLKMAKSTGNSYTLSDLEERGFEPLAFRYLCAMTHYRSRLNFTFSSLRAAQHGLWRLRNRLREWTWSTNGSVSQDPTPVEEWRRRFWDALEEDLGLPEALGVVWGVTRSDLPAHSKLQLVLELDRVLALGLDSVAGESREMSSAISAILRDRARLRHAGEYADADRLRAQIRANGYQVLDTARSTCVWPDDRTRVPQEPFPRISTSREVVSHLGEPDEVDLSVNLVVRDYPQDLRRCLSSILRWSSDFTVEAIVVDNGSPPSTAMMLEELARADPRVLVVHTDHPLGEAEARNIGIKLSRGKFVCLLDTSVEAQGDFYGPLERALARPGVGAIGRWGVRSRDLRSFEEAEEGDVDAVQGYFFAFRRESVARVGLMDEKFRFYRNLDLDYSFAFRHHGYRLMALSQLPLVRHVHRAWEELSEEEREKWSKRNFYRFLKRWGNRSELLVGSP